MSLNKICIFYILFMLLTAPAAAKIYKCPSSNGEITYSQIPCPNGFKQENGKWSSLKEERKKQEEARIQEEVKIQQEEVKLAEIEKDDIEEVALNRELKEEEERLKASQELAEQRKMQQRNERLFKSYPRVAYAISKSDDFNKYASSFVKASNYLLENDICTLQEFAYMKGWVRTVNYKRQAKYVTYCGDGKDSIGSSYHQIYLDVKTGELSGAGMTK